MSVRGVKYLNDRSGVGNDGFSSMALCCLIVTFDRKLLESG